MLKYFYSKHFTVKLVWIQGNDVRAKSWRRLAAIASTDRRYKMQWVGKGAGCRIACCYYCLMAHSNVWVAFWPHSHYCSLLIIGSRKWDFGQLNVFNVYMNMKACSFIFVEERTADARSLATYSPSFSSLSLSGEWLLYFSVWVFSCLIPICTTINNTSFHPSET